ncbi:polycomb protein Su(z)12 [Brevipalpus obovatus]|uniref:polycomb protein Su(z)12 n=1 Tax=Brevipalpus obovatus TaxID=246614 RepID=UPI003D9E140F
MSNNNNFDIFGSSKVMKINGDVQYADSNNNNGDTRSCDHDVSAKRNLLLQAFEKPTQIYRFLRTRHAMSPIFLHRTLSYMKHRMSRNHKRRKTFKIDNMLEERRHDANEKKFENLIIIGVGVFDKKFDSKNPAILEVSLVRFSHKKRKDTITPVSSVPVGKCEILVNPSDRPLNPVTITVPKEHFNSTAGHLVKYYSLQFKVSASHSQIMNVEIRNDIINGDSCDLPSFKRRKIAFREEYERELIVIDRYQQCVLTNGEYQIVLCESTKVANSPNHQYHNNKVSSWESLQQKEKLNGSLVVEKGPVLVFHLLWTDADVETHLDPGKILLLDSTINGKISSNNENNSPVLNGNANCSLLKRNGFIRIKTSMSESSSISSTPSTSKTPRSSRITYRFLYNGVVIQQTRSSQDLKCAWCSLKCKIVPSLMKHLKMCHMRFSFILTADVKGHRIDVTINENFDGSYSGNPHDLSHPTTGYAFSKNGPVQRSPVTQLLFFRGKKVPIDHPFLHSEDLDTSMTIRSYISGHDRLYYRSTDCYPIKPQDVEEDSEAEIDPEWMRVKTQLMIDEFTDVNEGEKELMKIWNLHEMKHGFVGDCQIPRACNDFVDKHWRDILEKNLYMNFILHLTNLFDFGILSASSMRTIIRRLNSFRVNDFENHQEE